MPEIFEANFAHATTDVAVPTTTETVAVSSPVVILPLQTHHILVFAYCQMTAGTGTTTVTPRIRRGTAVTDPLVGEGNAITLAAGNTGNLVLMVAEDVAGRDSVQYSLTVQQAAATANGTVLQAGILVLVM